MNAVAEPLPDLPSGRPRRLLLFTAGLQPDDLTLRAFDLARHLHAHGRWFARVVSSAEGPLRADFEALNVSVQVLDAPDDPAAVARQVWGHHQHAALAFGDAHRLAAPLAQRHQWPVLHETQEARAWFDPYASPERRADLRAAAGMTANDRLALAFATEARDEPRERALLRAIHDALREAALAGWHLGLVGADGGLMLQTPEGRESVRAFAPGSIARSAWVGAADAVLDLHKHGTGFRPLFDAAALAVPMVADPTPALASLLPASLFTAAEPGSPTDVADALIDLALNPGAAARRVASAHVFVMSHSNPARLIPEWIGALDRARLAWESEEQKAEAGASFGLARAGD
jgi:hypothetical protein